MKLFKVNGRKIAAKTISDAVEAYKAKRINLDDASASGTAELTDIINDLLQKKEPLDINERIDVNGKRVKGQIRVFWNGGEIQLGFTPKSGDFAMLGKSSSVGVPVDRKTKTVKRSDVNKAAQAIFEFADKQTETQKALANEKPKLLGYKLEFIEGEQSGIRKRMMNKLVDFDDMVRFLQGEEDRRQSTGEKGYDKAYIDAVYSIGGKHYRVHGARFDVGDGGDVRSRLKAETDYLGKLIEDFRKSGYSHNVKEGDCKDAAGVDFDYLLAEERKAVNDYRTAISQTDDPKLLTVLSHILKEETEHIKELEAARKGVYEDKGLMDAEAVIYQVTTSQDKMGRLYTEYFGSSEEVLRKHKGRIDPSSGHPRLDGFVGPFSNGIKNGKKVLLYEDKNTYSSMDSGEDRDEIETMKLWKEYKAKAKKPLYNLVRGSNNVPILEGVTSRTSYAFGHKDVQQKLRQAINWSAQDEISHDKPAVLKVTTADKKNGYIDFIVSGDDQNLYRYEKATGKMRKILGVGKGNFGNAIRGIDRKKVESVAKIVFERKLPFAVIA